MDASAFIRLNHEKYLGYRKGNRNSEFPDIGGVYTSSTVTKRGILDLPFHINRLYDSCLFLKYLQDSLTTLREFTPKILEAIDSALQGQQFCEGLIVICCGLDDSDKLDILAFFQAKPVSYLDSVVPCDYTVDFYPSLRHPAQLKYTKWALERQPIIDRRDQSIHETLIYQKDPSDGQDYLTEGLTSTFYIIKRDDTIVCPPTEKILFGCIQRWTLFVAQVLSIKMIIEPITMQSCREWKGAFVTSSGRIVQPVHRVVLNHDHENHNEKQKEIISFDPYANDHLLSKLKDFLFHLISCADSKNASEEMKEYERAFLEKIGYHPWTQPKDKETMIWQRGEFLEETTIEIMVKSILLVRSE
jgi:branched-subunit amino acid aminotransferase/4-amino-4-deoxychorismate lyase